MKKILLFMFITLPMIAFSQGSMDFEGLELTGGNSYVDGTIEDNGIVYTYNNSRIADTFQINGIGLLLRNASESYFEWEISNGIGELYFQYRKAFEGGNARQIEVLVNGEQMYNTNQFGSGSGIQETIYTFSEEINIEGSAVIRIKNVGTAASNKQFMLDNIVWTAYSPEVECEAPTNLQVVVNEDGTITATWDGTTPAPTLGYGIAVIPTGETPEVNDFLIESSPYVSDVLDPGTYDVVLVSVCDIDMGTFTPIVSEFVIETIEVLEEEEDCAPVTNIIVSNPFDDMLAINWNAPADATGQYRVVIYNNDTDETLHDGLVGNPTYSHFGTPDGNLTITVYAVCVIGEESYSEGVSTDFEMGEVEANECEDVTNLNLADNGDGTFTATWDAVAGAEGYDIEILTADTHDFVDMDFSSTNEFTSEVLEDGDYIIIVYTVCDDDASSDGVEETVTITTEVVIEDCETVVLQDIINNGDGTVTITWNAAPGAEGYQIMLMNLDTEEIAVNEFVTATTFTSEVLEDGGYMIAITTVCDEDEEWYSDMPSLEFIEVESFGACDDVTNLVVSANEDGSFTATWDAIADVDGYDIEIYNVTTETFVGLEFAETNEFTSDVLEDGEYSITVYTVCDEDEDETSAGVEVFVTIDTEEDVEECEDVTNLVIVDNEDGTFTATWDAIEGVDGYDVEIFDATTEEFVDVVFVETNEYTSEELDAGSYEIIVHTVCNDEEDLVSEGVEGTVTVSTVGLDTDKLAIVGLYPNPASTILNVETTDNGVISIIDLTGKVMSTVEATNTTTVVNVENLPKGVYLVKFQSNDTNSTVKFIKN